MSCITICNNSNTNQITDISTRQFILKLCSFMHIISMQSNAAAVTLSSSGSSRYTGRYPATSRSGFQQQVFDATAVNQVQGTLLLACRTGCMELTATRHSCCSQPCHVQETTQYTLLTQHFPFLFSRYTFMTL